MDAGPYWENEVSNPWASFSRGSTVKDSDAEEEDEGEDEVLQVKKDLHSKHVRNLVKAYRQSDVATAQDELLEQHYSPEETDSTLPNVFALTPPKRTGVWGQFTILSDRSFKNLYRNPSLMLAHYSSSVFLALLCGTLFYNVTNDIAGFQNRMGVFFFMCCLYGFGALTSLQAFSTERIVFMRERANGYYSPFAYFCAKILFDLIPLRVIPPILMGVVVYHMVGLVPGIVHFSKFLLVLVSFNLCAAAICLCLGIIFKELAVANLFGSLVMLFSMLFGGLLLNKDSIPTALTWLKDLSFFNYAFEAMIVNEMVYLQLTEKKYGLEIDVPGATILSTFGFDATAYWMDVAKLAGMCGGFILVAFLSLQILVKEKR
jgi:ABC-type multidrug transport system permease subunit